MEQLNILAIDGGNEMSGYCVLADDFTPLEFGKVANDTLLQMLPDLWERYTPLLAIERFENYGMPVGREVFDSCVWNGRFIERFMRFTDKWLWIKRKDEKLMICGTTRANDSNIRHALIERFAKHDLKNGKGTKKNPDFFYGFKADVWSAFAIGYTAFLIMEDGHEK